jgi:hypothetical protein
MIGSVIGVYNGKTFNQVEIKVCPLRFLAWYIFSFFLKLWLQDWKDYYTWHIHLIPQVELVFRSIFVVGRDIVPLYL